MTETTRQEKTRHPLPGLDKHGGRCRPLLKRQKQMRAACVADVVCRVGPCVPPLAFSKQDNSSLPATKRGTRGTIPIDKKRYMHKTQQNDSAKEKTSSDERTRCGARGASKTTQEDACERQAATAGDSRPETPHSMPRMPASPAEEQRPIP